jgi:hypothetical protein
MTLHVRPYRHVNGPGWALYVNGEPTAWYPTMLDAVLAARIATTGRERAAKGGQE